MVTVFLLVDESNWRNEYPDEDDDGDSSGCSNSSDDSDNIHQSHYRHREPYYGILINALYISSSCYNCYFRF